MEDLEAVARGTFKDRTRTHPNPLTSCSLSEDRKPLVPELPDLSNEMEMQAHMAVQELAGRSSDMEPDLLEVLL